MSWGEADRSGLPFHTTIHPWIKPWCASDHPAIVDVRLKTDANERLPLARRRPLMMFAESGCTSSRYLRFPAAITSRRLFLHPIFTSHWAHSSYPYVIDAPLPA